MFFNFKPPKWKSHQLRRMENECKYVSSRGLYKSTDIHMPHPESSTMNLDPEVYRDIQCGSTVYVCNSAIRHFRDTILPMISVPFILVSGDSDLAMPSGAFPVEEEFQQFIEDSRIHHWFCQNLMITHPKMTHMPIGMDYHTMSKVGEPHPWGIGKLPVEQDAELQQYIDDAPLQIDRHVYCYSNFHHSTFGIGSRGDRKEVIEKVPKDIVFYDAVFTSRDIAWNHQSFFLFVLSPRGGGYDCHRTWEALALGCIPIVKSSGLDPLFADLPVLIVKDWSELTRDLLVQTIVLFGPRSFQRQKMFLSYWRDLFDQKSLECVQKHQSNNPPLTYQE